MGEFMYDEIMQNLYMIKTGKPKLYILRYSRNQYEYSNRRRDKSKF